MRLWDLRGFPFGGLVLATAWWFVLFSPWTAPAHGFWWGMLFATGSLLGYSAWILRGQWPEVLRVNVRGVCIGLASAVLLYGLFRIGHAILLALFPESHAALASIYGRRAEASAWLIAVLLAVWIAPAEEIFWRGVLQRFLQRKLPGVWAWLIAAVLYALVHLWSGNLPLVLAALVLGLAWGGLFLWAGSLVPGILSHALWDVLVFVVLPLQ